MKKPPIKAQDYDNIDRVLNKRTLTWQYRLAREAFLVEVYKAVLEKNDLNKHIWLARAYGVDVMTDTAVTVNWTWYYPYMIGDPEYDEKMEGYARNTQCRIFFHIQGDEPGKFHVTVDYDYQGKDGKMEIGQRFEQSRFAKADLTAPMWFKPYLDRILKNNTPHFNGTIVPPKEKHKSFSFSKLQAEFFSKK